MWAPPGKTANANLWRYDVAKRSFVPPGSQSSAKGTQVEMPGGYTGTEPTGFHMLATPAGTQAPLEHINYTPETGEVSGRGIAAPSHMLNYTLMPQDALLAQQGAGQGQGSSPAMGAGAAVPTLGAMNQPGAFAGTPPLAGSPGMMGPSPTTNRASPVWGGGGTPFDTRMGMGADEDTGLLGDASTNPTGGGATGGGATGGGANAGDAQGGTTSSTTGTFGQTPINPMTGRPAVQGELWSETKDAQGNVVMRVYFKGMGQYGISPEFNFEKGTSPDALKPQYHLNDDGTVTIVDLTKNPPVVTKVGSPTPEQTALAQAKLVEAQANAALAKAKAEQANDPNAQAKAADDARKARADADRAQSDADKAATEAANVGKPTPKALDPKIVDATGRVLLLNPDTGHYDPTDIFEPAGTWQPYPNYATGTNNLYNPQTQQDVVLSPMDMYKEYPPQKAGGGKWIQWDPKTKTYKVVYTEDPDYNTQWSGDQLIAVNKNNPSDVKPIWTKTPTRAEDDAHAAAIDAHNTSLQSIEKTKQDLQIGKITAAQARVTIEKDIQNLLHPHAYQVSAGSLLIPAGANLDREDYDPKTGQSTMSHFSGGPLDPRVQQTVDQVNGWLDQLDLGPGKPDPGPKPETGPPPDTAGKQIIAGNKPKPTGTTPDVGVQIAGQDYKPGWPGSDPRLSGTAQPPTNRTTASGDIAHYDAQGNLIGITYKGTVGEDVSGDEAAQVPDVGAPDDSGAGNAMGAGMAAGATGWAPRSSAFAPATGPGFLGGVGSGAEGGDTYTEDGNPTDLMAWLRNLRMPTVGGVSAATSIPNPKDLQGGHVPGPPIKSPPGHDINQGETQPQGPAINVSPKPDSGTTDAGANWNPDLKGVVTSQVNEPLKKIMGWPKLEEIRRPENAPPGEGMQGGHDQPDIDPYDTINKKLYPPIEASDEELGPHIKDYSHLTGEGGTPQWLWDEMQNEEGMGKSTDPEVQKVLEEYRRQHGTTGVGQDEAPGMMPPSAGPPAPQIPPQGPGGQQPLPQWLLTLLQAHPELLKMAGLQGPATGGAPSPSPSPPGGAAGAPPPPPPTGQPAGDVTGSPPGSPSPPPSAGWTPPGGAPPLGGAPTPPPGGTPAPQASSPEGGPMQPPLDTSDVAGIGHRFGQQMNQGEPQHSGVDLQAPEGTPTSSPVDGFVTDVENNPEGLGITVVIKGTDGSEHRLGHLKSTSAYRGMQVAQGQDLGSPVGDTGMTTGAHLHWGVKDGQGQPSDPTQALGPMANMPPVPGTQMMGPPGGVGGGAQMGGGNVGWQPRTGAGQTDEDLGNTLPVPFDKLSPLQFAMYGWRRGREGGIQLPPGTSAGTRRMGLQDITPGATGTGQEPGWQPQGASAAGDTMGALQNRLQQEWQRQSQFGSY